MVPKNTRTRVGKTLVTISTYNTPIRASCNWSTISKGSRVFLAQNVYMSKCYFVYHEESIPSFIVPRLTVSLRCLQATENEIQVENNNCSFQNTKVFPKPRNSPRPWHRERLLDSGWYMTYLHEFPIWKAVGPSTTMASGGILKLTKFST
jgi:hypothetical protein